MADTMLATPAEAFISRLHSDNPSTIWSEQDQLQALELARATASPSIQEEDWRKTNPDKFPWERIEEVSDSTRREVQLKDSSGVVLKNIDAHRDILQDLMSIIGDDYDAKFLYYHKALHSEPVSVIVPKNKKIGFVGVRQTATGSGLAAFTTLIVVESGAELTLYDLWSAPDENSAVIGRTEVIVKEGGRLNYIQEDSLHDTGSIYRRARIRVERESYLNWTSLTPGAAWHAARLEIDIQGTNVEAHLNGLFTGSGNNCADHRTHQHHGAPNSMSNLTFKTLLAGKSHSIYQGVITVPQQSQKTDAYQKCRNLMLDPGTRADAIPKLEIIADDVKCSHGATIGTLNAEQMFYLRSRGLNYREALTAVASGFAEEIIALVPNEAIQKSWRERVSRTINVAGAHD